MKLPLSWLRQYVEFDLTLDELVDVMSGHGLEVEEVTYPGAGTAGVRTARVLHHEPHPNAHKLRVVTVTGDAGDGEIQVVCGASNFDTGDVVAHAAPGASIPGMRLEARDFRGVTSNGMLCSARELDLGDDHSGIIRLPADTPLGADLADLLPVGEPVIEIAVQADRGDHLGVVGVARDLAAIIDSSWSLPAVPQPPPAASFDVTIATNHCERFVTWLMRDVTVQPSPWWMRQRLAQSGIRSIDVAVDVTNYVMLELGQPLHAFDADAIRGERLNVRTATAGEVLVTLDDVERTLESGDVVIEDAERIASLAGVMGGRDTEVASSTTNVLLEAAVWNPSMIRATSRRLGLVSEASTRFERRVDPEGANIAAARAAGLLIELAGANADGYSDVRGGAPPWAQRSKVTVDPVRLGQLLGIDDLGADRQTALLRRSGCDVETSGDSLIVTAPSWRGDLARPADLAEEVARIHGYDSIPAVLPHVRVRGGLSASQQAERQIRRIALGHGFHEAIVRPFVGADALVGAVASTGRVDLANPLAKDAAAMRPSLVEGLIAAVRRNVGQGRQGVALAEVGRVFRPADDPMADALDGLADDWRWRDPDGAPLPVQPKALGLVAQGLRFGRNWLDESSIWGVHDLLAVFDDVVAQLSPGDNRRLERVAVVRERFHPGQSAVLRLAGNEIGFVGALHPHEAEQRDLPEPVVVGELLIEPLLRRIHDAGTTPAQAPSIVRHPSMVVDVALVAPDAVAFADLAGVIVTGAGDVLDDWWWFDEYRGAQIGEGMRSVAFRLRLHHAERQLTDEDAEAVIHQIEQAAGAVGATLRRH